MLRSEETSPELDLVFAPEAPGPAEQGNRVLKGRRPRVTPPALLPEREILAPAVPAVPPQANIRRASSAEDASIHTSKLTLRNIS
jgi:hypothetical protein